MIPESPHVSRELTILTYYHKKKAGPMTKSCYEWIKDIHLQEYRCPHMTVTFYAVEKML